MAEFDSSDFDDWYREVNASPVRDRLVNEWLGLPPGLESTGYLTGPGLDEVVAALQLSAPALLVELGCGRAGYGLAAAQRMGVSFTGVDFSSVAIASARAGAARLGLSSSTQFQVGELTATGLPDATADAVMCVDALHFATSVPAAAAELRRILVPGGRAVVTTWQARDPHSTSLPERVRRMDVERALLDAGFVHVTLTEKASWSAAEVAYWNAARQVDPGGDPAVQNLKDEAELFLPLADQLQRFLVTADAPQPARGSAADLQAIGLEQRSGGGVPSSGERER